jgi:hypothetical protein
MKRTFNFTGRRKIERSDVSILLREERDGWVFDAELRLAGYRFPSNAEVFVEAHRQNLWMQFSWGTIATLRAPTDRRLSEFDVPDGILFRVRVVLPAGPERHKLAGEADGLHFVKEGEADDRRRPLIEPVGDDLDQLLWKLDLDSEPPRLLVNNQVADWRSMARSAHFTAAVYPEVMRRVLWKILIDEEWTDDEEEDGGWQSDWVRFARALCGRQELPSPGEGKEREAWIDESVAAFARRHSLREQWERAVEAEGVK